MPGLEQFHSTWAFVGLILGFSFLIFVHELGHLLAAKWVGIKVTQFAIGFGPGVFSWRRGLGLRRGSTEPEYEKRLADGAAADTMGETEYRLNWVPLGGYVKMLGQDDLDPNAASQDERSFNRKPIWARACVVSAGVVMNLIFGVVFFIAAFMAGVDFPPAVVGGVAPGSPADKAWAAGHDGDEHYRGLRTDDRIVEINNQPVMDFADVAVSAALAGPEQPLNIKVHRQSEPAPLTFVVTPKEDDNTQLLSLGVARPTSLILGPVGPAGSLPAVLRDAGVKPEMQVTHVSGEPVEYYGRFDQMVSASRGDPVPVTFTDPSTGQAVQVSLEASPGLTPTADQSYRHLIGLVPAVRVPDVVPDSPAEKSGLQGGDILARLGPIAWPAQEEVPEIVAGARGGTLETVVLRDGQLIELPPISPDSTGRIGIMYSSALDEPLVARALPNTPAAGLHLNAGSRILAINETPVRGFKDIQRQLNAAVAQAAAGPDQDKPYLVPVTIDYLVNIKDAPPSSATIDLDAAWSRRVLAAAWGQPLSPFVFKMLTIPLKADNPVNAAVLGVKKTHQVMLQTAVTLLRLFQGTIKPSHLRGPIGIADDGTSFAKQGWSYLMFFLGLISVNLVVINFLPIPIVDGGLMIFLLIEKLKGSPVSARVQSAATVVGLALIGSVFLMTLFYDAKRLLGL